MGVGGVSGWVVGGRLRDGSVPAYRARTGRGHLQGEGCSAPAPRPAPCAPQARRLTAVHQQLLVALQVAPNGAHHDHGHDARHDHHHHERVEDGEPVDLRRGGRQGKRPHERATPNASDCHTHPSCHPSHRAALAQQRASMYTAAVLCEPARCAHLAAGHAEVGVPAGGPGDVRGVPVHVIGVHNGLACRGGGGA